MFKIPFFFRPIPDEFLTHEFLDDPSMMCLIVWMIKRISLHPQKIPLKNSGKHLILEPFEFMYGREKCAQDAGISLKNARTRLGQLIGLGYVQEVASKRASTYSVYRLVIEAFRQHEGQHIGQQSGQLQGQQSGHKRETKKKETKNIKETFNVATNNTVRPSLSDKQKEELSVLLAYCQDKNLQIFEVSLARWSHNYAIDHIVAHIGLLIQKRDKIRKHEAWLERALKENYLEKDLIIGKNREFAQNFQKNKRWSDLKITKVYCTHLPSGKDYQFNLPVENFQKMLTDCYDQYHQIEEASCDRGD